MIAANQAIELGADRTEAFARLSAGLLAAGVDPADEFDWDGTRPPYPGLLAFQEEDAAVFFGRDEEIALGLDLLNRISRHGVSGWALVLGASGSGKSSLVRAGLVHVGDRIQRAGSSSIHGALVQTRSPNWPRC